MGDCDWQALADVLKSKIECYQKEPADSWKLVKEEDNCKVFSKNSQEFSGYLYRAEGEIPISAEKCLELLSPLPGSSREKWDKAVEKFEIVESVNDGMKIIRCCTNGGLFGIVSNRDFVDLTVTYSTDDLCASVACSVEHANCDQKDGYVRGFNHPCGLLCFKKDKDLCQLVAFTQSDLRGDLPMRIAQGALPSHLASFFISLKKYVADSVN